MSTSNVRKIDVLEQFQSTLLKLANNWDLATQDIRMAVHRTQEHFKEERPAYWRHQIQLAERALTEAKDNLSRLRATVRPGDAPPATEAAQRVIKAEYRMRVCQDKERLARSWALEIEQRCEDLLGPLMHMTEHCQSYLPEAARELSVMVDLLHQYSDTRPASASQPVPPNTTGASDASGDAPIV